MHSILPQGMSLLVLLAVWFPLASASASLPELSQVNLLPRNGEALPLQIPLSDDSEAIRPLRAWLGNIPTIWIAADYTCKTLCGPIVSIVSNALVDTGLTAGTDYRLIVFGLDPKDTASDARAMKAVQVSARSDIAQQSVFLRGTPAQVTKLLTAFGIQASYDREHDQFAHPTAAFVVTADGRISRALSGIAIDPANLRLALVEAGHGHIGSWSDQAHLLCYGFDPATGVYTFTVWRMLTAAVVITMAAVTLLVALLIRRGASPKPS